MMKPAVKALLVEHVMAGELAHVLTGGEAVKADDAIGIDRIRTVFVGEETVEVEVVG
ncbi:hypothetical protein HanRHA438_Chr12g0545901 [Helianthus annuus]|nr:hypothetical protein HanRHA438_Chr12g0545901 [Helianthus annuus]